MSSASIYQAILMSGSAGDLAFHGTYVVEGNPTKQTLRWSKIALQKKDVSFFRHDRKKQEVHAR